MLDGEPLGERRRDPWDPAHPGFTPNLAAAGPHAPTGTLAQAASSASASGSLQLTPPVSFASSNTPAAHLDVLDTVSVLWPYYWASFWMAKRMSAVCTGRGRVAFRRAGGIACSLVLVLLLSAVHAAGAADACNSDCDVRTSESPSLLACHDGCDSGVLINSVACYPDVVMFSECAFVCWL